MSERSVGSSGHSRCRQVIEVVARPGEAPPRLVLDEANSGLSASTTGSCHRTHRADSGARLLITHRLAKVRAVPIGSLCCVACCSVLHVLPGDGDE